jgi:hypothetical protein
MEQAGEGEAGGSGAPAFDIGRLRELLLQVRGNLERACSALKPLEEMIDAASECVWLGPTEGEGWKWPTGFKVGVKRMAGLEYDWARVRAEDPNQSMAYYDMRTREIYRKKSPTGITPSRACPPPPAIATSTPPPSPPPYEPTPPPPTPTAPDTQSTRPRSGWGARSSGPSRSAWLARTGSWAPASGTGCRP